MNMDDWKSQIKRGTLEFCILLMIKRKPSYGYEIISKLEQYPILAAKENTIYPLLGRLMKEEYVSSSWQESAEGLPPRKYYSITEKGLACISAMSEEWDSLQRLGGGDDFFRLTGRNKGDTQGINLFVGTGLAGTRSSGRCGIAGSVGTTSHQASAQRTSQQKGSGFLRGFFSFGVRQRFKCPVYFCKREALLQT